MQNSELYKTAVKTWGQRAQLQKVIEECAELIQAICKRDIKPDDEKVIENVLEECADVKIMTGQLEYMIREEWGLSDQYDAMLCAKHLKLEKRLDKYTK